MAKPDIDFSKGRDFKPKVNHKLVWMFYTGAGIFIIVPLVLYIYLGPEMLPALLAMSGLPLLIIFLVWLQTSGIMIRYHVHPQGIYLKRSWFTRYYPREDIAFLKQIPDTRAMELANEINDRRVEGYNRIDPAMTISSHMDMGQLIAFSSVQFVGSDVSGTERGVGGPVIHKSDVKTKGDFLVLGTKNGEVRLFTPKDMDGFVRQFEEFRSNGQASQVS